MTPNATRLDIHSLYRNEIQEIVKEIRKNANAKGVNFVSSNPDFAVIRIPDFEHKYFDLNEIEISDLDILDNYYQNLLGKVNFKDLTGFLSVKTSFRPDRRLQIAHEGSLIKAMHYYIGKNITCSRDTKLVYQAISTNATKADLKALKTLAPHSISIEGNHLEPAIDNVKRIDCFSSAEIFFKDILN